MSCGGTTKKMQKGGASGIYTNTTAGEISTVKLQKGGAIKKMQKGGYPVKNFINNNLKPLLKIPTYPGQTYKKDTGRNITEKAAARKVAKGKGFMTYQSKIKSDPEGTGDNKGIFNSNFYGRKPRVVMQNGGTADPSQSQIDRNKIKQTGSTWRGGTRSKEVTLDQNLYDPNKNSGAVTRTKRNAAGEIIKQKTRIVSNAKAQKKYNKIFNSNNRQTKTCFSGNCK